jgi:hypothetical protein
MNDALLKYVFFDPSQTAQSCNAAEGNLHLWPFRALGINHAAESFAAQPHSSERTKQAKRKEEKRRDGKRRRAKNSRP